MIILIAGASHTGKTNLAQKMMSRYGYPYMSIDHLKMGLIRSGQTSLSPLSEDEELTEYLWPIVREMIKTAIENKQNLIVEGCYIPFNWKNDFSESCLPYIKCVRLVMSEKYILNHFDVIMDKANVIENRVEDSYCTKEEFIKDNRRELEMCNENKEEYCLIDTEYDLTPVFEITDRFIKTMNSQDTKNDESILCGCIGS